MCETDAMNRMSAREGGVVLREGSKADRALCALLGEARWGAQAGQEGVGLGVLLVAEESDERSSVVVR